MVAVRFETSSYLPTFKFQKEEQMREKKLKRGTFLNLLYITIQRLLQKQEHMIKSFSFLLRKEELFLQKRNSWQVCQLHEWAIIFSLHVYNYSSNHPTQVYEITYYRMPHNYFCKLAAFWHGWAQGLKGLTPLDGQNVCQTTSRKVPIKKI